MKRLKGMVRIKNGFSPKTPNSSNSNGPYHSTVSYNTGKLSHSRQTLYIINVNVHKALLMWQDLFCDTQCIRSLA